MIQNIKSIQRVIFSHQKQIFCLSQFNKKFNHQKINTQHIKSQTKSNQQAKQYNFKPYQLKMDTSKLKITFIGAGKMATAIAGGLVKSGKYTPSQFTATDKSEASREHFIEKSQVTNIIQDNILASKFSDVIILAVKPQQIEEVCKEIAEVCQDKLIISIAAGTKLETFYKLFGHKRIIRVMPNTPMMVGIGASAFSMGDQCKETDRDICLSIFSPVGKIHQVEECHMDAVTAVSGSGPAYVFQFIKALADAGVQQGLQPEVSLDLATQTVLGAAMMVSLNQGTPEELTKAVTSPNGTTYAALCCMEKLQFKETVYKFVEAATNRSIELGGGKPKQA
ncbi:pyrroline-5-carboxylate reductase (macronuclear) [Tetrahymena thermophila SB210]|uniref:Pyrroline-5-carboxylate reductase n=1 Tax=Tetrahymena thermophila (strain SB210) TaxID=312017 RepID=Q233Y5_TETTS|nr:pyrroline-5-carboxylate reductase [Tetrahymena thermophila SB210]EAR92117.2 pyrroline-5-carboxylate reductase [Tetrahymena thermophila SB210]|eukprot:XP_001012363.2 pyrroline-5-carboxylate reductase [Tetrahymena thermophila SB210]